MIKKRFLPVAGILITLAIPLLLAVPNAVASSNCNGVETSIDFQCDTYDTDGVSAIIMYVINFMAVGVGIAVVIGIIFGGITYAQSDGEESKAKEGREMIANSIIGLFLFLFLYAGADFLLPGGAFNLNAKPAAVAHTSTGSPSQTGSPTSLSSKQAAALKALQNSSTISNVRDAGASGYIKSGILFRSANLNSVSTTDKSNLGTLLKGGTIVDLRRTTDKGYKKDPAISGVSRNNIEIKGEASASGYRDTFIKDADARKQFAEAIRAIAGASSDKPILIHCKSGKDRTGWTIALVMMAVGVSKANAMSEYLKSPNVDASWFNAAYDEAIKKSHSNDGTIIGYMTTSVSDGGLGLSQSTIQTLKDKFKK